MRSRLSTLAVLSFVLLLALPAFAEIYRVDLGGGLSADPDGTGFGIFTIEGTTISYTMSFSGIDTPVAAHIHTGGNDETGGVVVNLMPNFGTTSATGSVTADEAVIQSIRESPGAFYVNIHTQNYPDGAIRGQLELVASSPSSLTLFLDGAAEVPGPGDRDGSAIATLDLRTSEIDYTIQVLDVDNPTASHIHIGTALESGPIFVDLEADFENGIATGSVPIDASTRTMILDNLENFYLNVHSQEFPGGAVRAQLGKEWVLPIVGKSQGANNTNFVTDVRILNLSAEPATIRMDFYPSTQTGLEGPSISRTITIPASSQAVANDIVGNVFDTTGLGAMTFVSSRDLKVIGRVINDLRDQGLGTNGLFIEAPPVVEASTSGTLPFLSNASVEERTNGEGFRTNVGFFNPTSEPIELTVQTHRSNDGMVFGTTTVVVQPFQHLQQGLFSLVTGVPEEEQDRSDFYATWTSDGPMFVYAAVTDNKTGDALVVD